MFLVLLWYVMPGCFALPCPKNFRAQSDLGLFCAPDNNNLKPLWSHHVDIRKIGALGALVVSVGRLQIVTCYCVCVCVCVSLCVCVCVCVPCCDRLFVSGL